MLGYTNIPNAVINRVKRAGALTLKARAAALAGDQLRAAALRATYDAIYDTLEVELYGETTAEFMRNHAPEGELQETGMNSNKQHSNRFF